RWRLRSRSVSRTGLAPQILLCSSPCGSLATFPSNPARSPAPELSPGNRWVAIFARSTTSLSRDLSKPRLPPIEGFRQHVVGIALHFLGLLYRNHQVLRTRHEKALQVSASCL